MCIATQLSSQTIKESRTAVEELRALHFYISPTTIQKGYFTNSGHIYVQETPKGWTNVLIRIFHIVKRWIYEKKFNNSDEKVQALLQWGTATLPKALEDLNQPSLKSNISFQQHLLSLRNGITDIESALIEQKFKPCQADLLQKLSDMAQNYQRQINSIFYASFCSTPWQETEKTVHETLGGFDQPLSPKELAPLMLLPNQINLLFDSNPDDAALQNSAYHICAFNRAIHHHENTPLADSVLDLEAGPLFLAEQWLIRFPQGAEILQRTATEMGVKTQIEIPVPTQQKMTNPPTKNHSIIRTCIIISLTFLLREFFLIPLII